MDTDRAKIGSLQEHGVISLLEDAYRDTWSGAFRLTTATSSGTIWIVRGQAVHANCVTSQDLYEGMGAFELLVGWMTGSYHIDNDILPPGRTIRLPMSDLILAAKQSARRALIQNAQAYTPTAVHLRLHTIMTELRQRVPGLESLSLINENRLQESTSEQSEEREWIGNQVKLFSERLQLQPETLFLKMQGRALLMIGDANESTVLSAAEDTAPEAMFWAGKEAVRKIRSRDEVLTKD
jgi:hypothetical protein